MIRLGELKIYDSHSLINAQLKVRRILPKLNYGEILAVKIEAIIENLFREILGRQEEIDAEVFIDNDSADKKFLIRIEVRDEENLPFVYLFDLFESKVIDGKKNIYVGFDIESYNIFKDEAIEQIKAQFDMKTRSELMLELNHKNDQLEKSEQFLQSLLSNIKSAIYTKNLIGEYTYVNSECEKLVQRDKKELIGKTDKELFEKQVCEELEKNDELVVEKKKSITTEDRIVDNHGDVFYFLTTKVPMLQDNKVVGICCISIDISERKQMEEELVIAKSIAEEASRAKADFLANMSHEIRTPMNAIMGMSYLMQKTDLTSKQKNYLDKICKSSQHLLGIINDILDFSKIEAGKLEIEKIKFKLSDVLDNLATLVGQKCSEKGLELVFDVEPGLSNAFLGDPLRLGQILINFTNNAVKFTETGQIIIRIRKHSKIENKEVIKFEVEDSGIGIKKEHLASLFKSFQQADTSTTRKYGGTGLGLAISKNLAELMNGEVGVKSEYGKGSVFWFTAELVEDYEMKAMDILRKMPKKYRVLVVDDNENSREVLKEMLSYMGCIVETADSGEIAVDKVRKCVEKGILFDIVYMDFQLVEINGIETFKRIKEITKLSVPKGIMVTNFGREEIILEAKNTGFEMVLVKPVNPIILYESTMEVLGIKEKDEKEFEEIVEDGSSELLTKNINVLLVEDNELNQEVAKEIIESFGFIVDIAENGEKSIDKVSNNDYDIVLMDMQMPVMDGISATKKIRNDLGKIDIPIIAMTANAMEDDKEKCSLAGMNDHLSKPIDPKHLLEMIKKWSNISQVVANENLKDLKEPCNLEKLLHVDGFDAKAGCNRVMGKKKTYIRLLKRFVEEEAFSVDNIENAVVKKDYEKAEYLTHTLKGVTGNIGATRVYELVLDFENTLKNHKDDANLFQKIPELKSVYNKLIRDLDDIMGKDFEDEKIYEVRSPKQMDNLISQYRIFIEKRKTRECKEFAQKCKSFTWPEYMAEDVSKLGNMLERYKYKDALVLCDELEQKLREA